MVQSRTRYLIGNWKMNLVISQAKSLIEELGPKTKHCKHTRVFVCPPFTALQSISSLCRSFNLGLGAQNVHWENEGAFTGDISVPMLKDLECSLALVGHSERRRVGGESDHECALRARHALRGGLTVVFCIGEERAARDAGTSAEALSSQLAPLFEEDFPPERLIIAYEPVWAIGAKNSASTEQIRDTHHAIKEIWDSRASNLGPCPPILYGGSVSPGNFKQILSTPLVAGSLVGRASLGAASFAQLIEISEQTPFA